MRDHLWRWWYGIARVGVRGDYQLVRVKRPFERIRRRYRRWQVRRWRGRD